MSVYKLYSTIQTCFLYTKSSQNLDMILKRVMTAVCALVKRLNPKRVMASFIVNVLGQMSHVQKERQVGNCL